MSDGTDVGKGESMWNAWETVARETVAAKDRQNMGGRDDASKRDAVKGQSEWPWFAIYHILHKQNSWPSCVHQLSYHPFSINPSKSPLFGQMKSSCSYMFTMIFPYFPMVSIGFQSFFYPLERPQAAPVCRAARITLGGAMVVAICRTVASSAWCRWRVGCWGSGKQFWG